MTVSSETVLDWDGEKARRFEKAVLRFRHGLAERPMFEDAALATVLDRYPRERLGVYTMGEDLTDWRSWRRVDPGSTSGERLMEGVRAGRLWLNLRHADQHLPEYAELCREIAEEKERFTGRRVFARDLGLLISSPRALVFYHLDVPLSSLWQIRGEKRIWFYPRRPPFVTDDQIERCVRKEAEGQFPYDPAWDAEAESFEMRPGDMTTWPQNMPHRVENGPMVNVSLSMEFMTPAAAARANVLYANGALRQALGARPRVQAGLDPRAAAKIAFTRTAKLMRPREKAYRAILPADFVLDPSEPGKLAAIAAAE